jgi:hypothetical protein
LQPGLHVLALVLTLQMVGAYTRAMADAALFVDERKPSMVTMLEKSTAEMFALLTVGGGGNMNAVTKAPLQTCQIHRQPTQVAMHSTAALFEHPAGNL